MAGWDPSIWSLVDGYYPILFSSASCLYPSCGLGDGNGCYDNVTAIAAGHACLRDNTQIDYVDTLRDSGFKYSNPNAKSSCGCGTSFS